MAFSKTNFFGCNSGSEQVGFLELTVHINIYLPLTLNWLCIPAIF